jgi:hypothetical protein
MLDSPPCPPALQQVSPPSLHPILFQTPVDSRTTATPASTCSPAPPPRCRTRAGQGYCCVPALYLRSLQLAVVTAGGGLQLFTPRLEGRQGRKPVKPKRCLAVVEELAVVTAPGSGVSRGHCPRPGRSHPSRRPARPGAWRRRPAGPRAPGGGGAGGDTLPGPASAALCTALHSVQCSAVRVLDKGPCRRAGLFLREGLDSRAPHRQIS